MKSHYILLLFLMCITIPAAAQLGEERRNFSVGINAGVTLNNVTFMPKIKQNSLMGYTGGFTARYISEKYFAMICGLQMELNFTQHGWDENIEDTTNDTYSRVMNYVEIPFLAHLAFGRERGVRFFLNLGPQIGILLSEKENYSDPFSGDRATTGVYQQYGMMADRKIDYGITGGGGLELRTKIGHFLAEGRYYYGLADFYNNSKRDVFSQSSHGTIMIKLTYLFDIMK